MECFEKFHFPDYVCEFLKLYDSMFDNNLDYINYQSIYGLTRNGHMQSYWISTTSLFYYIIGYHIFSFDAKEFRLRFSLTNNLVCMTGRNQSYAI